VLDRLSSAVEDLLLGGLTTASDATRQTISGAMQEAARMRLLRLGAILRVLTDDLARFNNQDPLLSRRRLTLFLNRGWLIARGLSHALETGNEKEYDRLNLTPTTQQLARADIACMGVVKKVTAAVVQFQFRFRALTTSTPVKSGDALAWSFNQPVKNRDFPPEAYLHLAQKQKFTPFSLLDRKIITVQNAVVVPDEAGTWRLSLTDQSLVNVGSPFAGWAQFLDWTPGPARERLAKQTPGPLDLDTELQEEVIFSDYEIGAPAAGEEPGQTVYPLRAGRFELHALVGPAGEGAALKKGLDELRKLETNRPPLYGLMHYERCRLVLQALTTFGTYGPDYLTISPEKVDKGALIRELF
jgi:hypothetical protein